MKNIWNNLFDVSQRSKGRIDENGNVFIDEILSYDIVANPSFSNASFDDINDLHLKIQKELDRQELLKNRKEKLNKLNNL